MEFEINLTDIKTFSVYVQALLKRYEKEEAYEVCSELHTFQNKISDYILGYIDTNEIQCDLYAFCKIEGELLDVNIFHCSCVFQINNGQKFYFCDIDLREMGSLLELYEENRKKEIKEDHLFEDDDED
jgi:hypothetical protein